MRFGRFSPRLLLAFLVASPLASALDVFNYTGNETTFERFTSGFPGAPVINTGFFLNGFDLSGIGWTSGNFGITMITPQHFVTAEHVRPANGSTVSFVNTGGALVTYTVDST